jgi:hypothetical protein
MSWLFERTTPLFCRRSTLLIINWEPVSGKERLAEAKRKLDPNDQLLIDILLNKRAPDTHASGELAMEAKRKVAPAERFPGVSVVGPVLPVTDCEAAAAQVGMERGWLAAIVTEDHTIKVSNKQIEVAEACAHCLALFEKLPTACLVRENPT